MKKIKVKTKTTEFSLASECFMNVSNMVVKHGGEAIYCWYKGLTYFPEIALIDSYTHHCIWKDTVGNLWDITPQTWYTGKIIFPEEVEIIIDQDAVPIIVKDGLYKVKPDLYIPIEYSDKTLNAIKALESADRFHDEKNYEKEFYWTERAAKILGGWIQPKEPSQHIKFFRMPHLEK